MATNTDWVAILGAVTGVASAIALLVTSIVGFTTKPKLVFSEGPVVRKWRFLPSTEERMFVNFEVKSKTGRTARRCVAKALTLKYPVGITHLQKEYSLHWADIPYSGATTGGEAVDIGAENRRLDVVFAVPSISGASIAIPAALSLPGQIPQASLPPGDYEFKIVLTCDNGRGHSVMVKITSGKTWEELSA
ncbi:MAG TPA: hypothetical protein VGA82_00725, partial [Dehalococcoidales bacterium]